MKCIELSEKCRHADKKKVEKKMKNANKRPAVKHDGVDSIDGE